MIPMSSSLLARRKAKEKAENLIRSCTNESEVVECLTRHEPEVLNCGGEQWIDKAKLDHEVKEMYLKLKINGFSSRAERFQYLQSTLEKKWTKKPNYYSNVMKFLLEMSERPTSVLNLEVESVEYSPNETMPFDDIKAYLKEISFFSTHGDDTVGDHSASDSDLSDWGVSDEEPTVKEPSPKLTHSQSLEFKKIRTFEEDEERERDLYWTMESIRSKNYLDMKIRKVNLDPLENQPVISTFLTVHSKFGSFWEWKRRRDSQAGISLITLEQNIIREILWQFSSPNNENSFIFTKSWGLKDNIMVGSLSKSSLSSFLSKYGQALATIQELKHFTSDILSSENLNSQPNIYKAYSEGIGQVLNFISSNIELIEKNLRLQTSSKTPASSTLFQMDRQVQEYLEIIVLLKHLHTNSIISEWTTTDEYICSLKLISNLEIQLQLQTKLLLYKIILFLYIKCMTTFLQDIFILFSLFDWNHKKYLFIRNQEIKLNDINFWKETIKPNPLEVLNNWQLTPPIFLKELNGKFLILLKTIEVLKQLEQDPEKLLGKLPSPGEIISEFIQDLFSDWGINPASLSILPSSSSTVNNSQNQQQIELGNEELEFDYNLHFGFLGLESNPSLESFDFLTSKSSQEQVTAKVEKKDFQLNEFLLLAQYPIREASLILRDKINETILPYYMNAQKSLLKIFQDNKLEESFKLFREIILGGREDFTDAVLNVISQKNLSQRFKYESETSRDSDYQKVLNECYPEGRENFTITLKTNPEQKLNYYFDVTPLFPLNLALNSDSIKAYLYISEHLMRIRKSLKIVNQLNFKECKLEHHLPFLRVLLFRFALIHYCSSIRAFFMLKIFGKNLNVSSICEGDMESIILKTHEIEYNLIENKLINKILLRKMEQMCEALEKSWTEGVSLKVMIILEDTLKKCWMVINDFSKKSYRVEFNEFAAFFGPTPQYLLM